MAYDMDKITFMWNAAALMIYHMAVILEHFPSWSFSVLRLMNKHTIFLSEHYVGTIRLKYIHLQGEVSLYSDVQEQSQMQA